MSRTLAFDLRDALRSLRRQPWTSVVVIATLAVGIGASAAIFGVVDAVLLRPLPYPESEELVAVWGRFDPESGFDFPRFPLSDPEYLDYREQTQTLEGLAAYYSTGRTVTGGSGEPERVTAYGVTASFFQVLGVRPLVGRVFTDEEDRASAAAVQETGRDALSHPAVVLQHAFWQSRFGADPGIIGRNIRIGGVATAVVGVMPPGFDYPGPEAQMWLPSGIDPASPSGRSSHYLRVVGRLAEGVGIEQARAELETLMAAWKSEYPDIHTGHYLFVRPLLEDVTGNVRAALLMLLGATGFVLLIVCANLASVVLARGEERQRELAIRAALGARPRRMLQLLLAESILLALGGGSLGLLMASFGVDVLKALHAGSLPRAAAVAVDLRVIGAAAAVSLMTGIVFGLVPALRAAFSDPQSGLRAGARDSGGVGSLRFRRALVATQVALAFVLVLGAGLVSLSFMRLLSVDPGFRTDGIVVARLSLPATDYPDDVAIGAFFRDLVERVRVLPGVDAASIIASLPIANAPGVWDFRIDGRPQPAPGEPAWNAAFTAMHPGWFETVGARLVGGRFFDESDAAGAPAVGVINEAMAERFFAGVDPIGQRIQIASGDARPWMTVVGVVANLRFEGLDLPARPAYYGVHAQLPDMGIGAFRTMYLTVRSEADPGAVAASVRGVVRRLDTALPLFEVASMQQVIAEGVARPRFTAVLLGTFSTVALLLGVAGIYGVLAYAVARRKREIGIRKALGAHRSRVAVTVIRQGMMPVLAGLAIGLVVSIWTRRLLGGVLFGISPTDWVTHLLVALALAGVGLVACAVPTWRALRVDPVIALKGE